MGLTDHLGPDWSDRAASSARAQVAAWLDEKAKVLRKDAVQSIADCREIADEMDRQGRIDAAHAARRVANVIVSLLKGRP